MSKKLEELMETGFWRGTMGSTREKDNRKNSEMDIRQQHQSGNGQEIEKRGVQETGFRQENVWKKEIYKNTDKN